VIWNISDVKGPDKWHNVTITPIIQEIVNQYGWESGNSLALIILSEKGNIRRQFTSADYMNPAKLYITITPPTPPEENYELIETYKGYEIYNVTVGEYPYVDFTEFTEVDPEDELTVSKYQVTFNYDLEGDYAYIIKDYGKNYFHYFTHNFTLKYYSLEAGTTANLVLTIWEVSQNPGVHQGDDYIYVGVREVGDQDNKYKLQVYVRDGGSTYSSWIGTYEYSAGVEYYLSIEVSGNVRLRVYEDEEMTTLLEDSGGLARPPTDDYQYLILAGQVPTIGGSQHYGYIKNLMIEKGELNITDWWIEIWQNGSRVIDENFTSLDDAINYIDNVLIGPEEQPYNPKIGGYEVIPRRYVKLSFLMSGLGLMMVGLIAISYKPTLGRAIMGILIIVLAMGLLIHLTQI